MDNIDLTLRGDFVDGRGRLFNDARGYDDTFGYEDQRQALSRILDVDSTIKWFGITLIHKEHLTFFGDNGKRVNPELEDAQTTYDITGIATEALRLEWDAGYGNLYICDCCGRFKSPALNEARSYLCERCDESEKLDNRRYWERDENGERPWRD